MLCGYKTWAEFWRAYKTAARYLYTVRPVKCDEIVLATLAAIVITFIMIKLALL